MKKRFFARFLSDISGIREAKDWALTIRTCSFWVIKQFSRIISATEHI